MKTKTKTKNLKKSRTMKLFQTCESKIREKIQKSYKHYCDKCDSYWDYEETKATNSGDLICPGCNELIDFDPMENY